MQEDHLFSGGTSLKSEDFLFAFFLVTLIIFRHFYCIIKFDLKYKAKVLVQSWTSEFVASIYLRIKMEVVFNMHRFSY